MSEAPRTPEEQPIPISPGDLSPEALRNVLVDLVSRGEPDEMSIDRRCDQLLQALQRGKAQLLFDPVEETIFLKPR